MLINLHYKRPMNQTTNFDFNWTLTPLWHNLSLHKAYHSPLFKDQHVRCTKLKLGELKRLTPATRTTHWPPLHGLPYGLLHGLPYGLPLRTTLKKQPNSFYAVQKYKKLTCFSYTIITARKTAAIFFSYISRPSLFHFAPFFTGRPPARTLFPQWTIGKRCWIFIFVICLKCLSST